MQVKEVSKVQEVIKVKSVWPVSVADKGNSVIRDLKVLKVKTEIKALLVKLVLEEKEV